MNTYGFGTKVGTRLTTKGHGFGFDLMFPIKILRAFLIFKMEIDTLFEVTRVVSAWKHCRR